jgi:SCY1-like protein 2
LSGLALAIPLQQLDGSRTLWEFPQWEHRLPSYIQRSFDYMGKYYFSYKAIVDLKCDTTAPEYAIDEQLDVNSDMYSLGCLIYAIHMRGLPPFRNHGSLQNLRDNAGKPLTGIESLDLELQSLCN